MITELFNNINSNLYSGSLLLDFKKAFDTASHNILLFKLSHYGIRGSVLDPIRSYLNHRTQYVFIHNVSSDIAPLRIGVPQGSSLGPLLFSIYINDLPWAVESIPRLFADDTCSLNCDPSLLKLHEKVNHDLNNVEKWCEVNKVTINPEKSSAVKILFHRTCVEVIPQLK